MKTKQQKSQFYDQILEYISDHCIKLYEILINDTDGHNFTLISQSGDHISFQRSLLKKIPYFEGMLSTNMLETELNSVKLDFNKEEIEYMLWVATTGIVFNKEEISNLLPNGTFEVDHDKWIDRFQVLSYFGLNNTQIVDWFSSVITNGMNKKNTSLDDIKTLVEAGLNITKLKKILTHLLKNTFDEKLLGVLYNHKNYGIKFITPFLWNRIESIYNYHYLSHEYFMSNVEKIWLVLERYDEDEINAMLKEIFVESTKLNGCCYGNTSFLKNYKITMEEMDLEENKKIQSELINDPTIKTANEYYQLLSTKITKIPKEKMAICKRRSLPDFKEVRQCFKRSYTCDSSCDPSDSSSSDSSDSSSSDSSDCCDSSSDCCESSSDLWDYD